MYINKNKRIKKQEQKFISYCKTMHCFFSKKNRHSWMPFSFLAPVCAMVCASVKFNVTWFNKFYLYKDTILLSNFN